MTSNEILKADVLDIVFEGRNKQYGAYVLRRGYDSRMIKALLSSIVPIMILLLLVKPGGNGIQAISDVIKEPVVIKEVDFKPQPLQEQPPQTQQRRVEGATVHHTNNIVIDPNTTTSTVASIDVLENSNPGTETTDGPADGSSTPSPNGTVQTVTPLVPEPATSFEAPISSAPQFPGGAQAWMAFLTRHLQVPAEMQAGEKVTVMVRFLVSEDGTVKSFHVLQSGGTSFDAEVLRVLKKMPKWKPAIQAGNPISVTFTQPVTFQAAEE
jgi:protein TonB